MPKINDEIVDEALHRLINTAAEAAAAKAERGFQEGMLRPTKALCMKDAEAAGHNSGIMQEREAYANPRYVQQLEKVRDAVKIDEEIAMKRRGWQTIIDVWRTEQANARQNL
jgi:hypothetical protein